MYVKMIAMEFMVSGFILLVTVFKPTSEAHEAPGIYCNGMTQTRNEAMEGCTKSCKGGSLVLYNTGIGKTVAELNLRSDVDVWTAEYAKQCTGNGQSGHRFYQKLCGFVYLNNSLLHVNNEVLYGNCSVERNYVCKDAANNWIVNQSTWESIKPDCKKPVNNLDNVNSGFYWTMNSTDIFVEKEPTLPTSGSVICGAYTPSVGQYFTNCETRRASLCHCSHSILLVESLHKSCFNRQTTLTNSPLTSSTIRTTKIVSTMVKQTKRDMETIIGTDTHSITSTTENNLQSTRTQLMAESTTSLNETKVQKHEIEKQRKEENVSDLSVEVGLPVGLCMALIFGITLTIYLGRRYKFLKRKTDCNQNNSRKAQHPRSSKYSFGTAHAHFNASYEASEEIAIKKISNDDQKNVSENSNRNKQHHSDSNSEYAVVHKTKSGKTFNSDKNKQNLYCFSYGYKDNCASSNEFQTAEYSFARETCTDEVYDVERCHTESDDYDVTGNIPTCTSNISSNIYNKFQSNEYDSTASVGGNDCNHMYDVTQNQRSESVYDSTNDVHNSKRYDNVYNQLSRATPTSNKNN